jgi:hypothetical protein
MKAISATLEKKQQQKDFSQLQEMGKPICMHTSCVPVT